MTKAFAIWCASALPASIIFASLASVSAALEAGASLSLPPLSVFSSAIGAVLVLQPVLWLVLAAWVGAARLLPQLDRSWVFLGPCFVAGFVLFAVGVTLTFYSDPLSIHGVLSFSLLSALLLIPRLCFSQLAPGAFCSAPAA